MDPGAHRGPDKEITFTREGKRAILNKLVEAEGFEKFLDVRYTGTKRFGLRRRRKPDPGAGTDHQARRQSRREGDRARHGPSRPSQRADAGDGQAPPRAVPRVQGRLLGAGRVEGSGDVKYHLGASSDREFDGNQVHLSLTANPSHLEIVDPVVLGKARAKQDLLRDAERTQVMPLLLHGDAAFAGQGVVAECLGLSGLKGHRTGGSIHFIINNQIGFTTYPRFSRSSPYPSDVAKTIEAPIFHVNGDDPEAVTFAAKIATEFRQRFRKPVVVDMFCYRRFGHNEGDEPAFTQPLMYKLIKQHPTTLELYSRKLEAKASSRRARSTPCARNGVRSSISSMKPARPISRTRRTGSTAAGPASRPLPPRTTRAAASPRRPRRTAHDRRPHHHRAGGLPRPPHDPTFLDARRKAILDDGAGIDWSTAEALAFTSLQLEGHPVRLSGQDCERGTFSQRHSVLIDQETEERHTPFNHVREGQAHYEVINSMLSEEAVLGFEYG